MLRDKKMALLGMLSIGLVGTWVYHLYDKTLYARNPGAPEKVAAAETSTQDSLQRIYTSMIDDMDQRLSLTQTNADSMRGQLEVRLQEIETLRGEINAILQNSRSSKQDLASAQAKINQLQEMISSLEGQKHSMEEEKRQLTSTMSQLNQRVDSLTQDIRRLGDENKKLATRVNEASIFVASFIHLAGVTVKNGRETETSQLKKVSKFVVSFNIQNHISDYDNAEVFVAIIQPDGSVVKNDDIWESTTTTSATGAPISYTRKIRFDYEKGQLRELIFSVSPEDFQKGTYTMRLFHKGVNIGESRLTLN